MNHMIAQSSTPPETIRSTVMARLSPDLLLAIFDAGVAMGLGIAPEMAASADVEQLISSVRTRWFAELDAARAWRRSETPDLRPDQIPEWLRAQTERVAALGDAEPPEGWHTAPLGGAR